MQQKKTKIKTKDELDTFERILKTATIISDQSEDDEVGLNNTVKDLF